MPLSVVKDGKSCFFTLFIAGAIALKTQTKRWEDFRNHFVKAITKSIKRQGRRASLSEIDRFFHTSDFEAIYGIALWKLVKDGKASVIQRGKWKPTFTFMIFSAKDVRKVFGLRKTTFAVGRSKYYLKCTHDYPFSVKMRVRSCALTLRYRVQIITSAGIPVFDLV
jgi:hypothetical protein